MLKHNFKYEKSDTALLQMRKAELVELVRTLEHEYQRLSDVHESTSRNSKIICENLRNRLAEADMKLQSVTASRNSLLERWTKRNSNRVRCQFCKQYIDRQDRYCKHCGESNK